MVQAVEAILIGQGDICAGVEQQLDQSLSPASDGLVQRRVSVSVLMTVTQMRKHSLIYRNLCDNHLSPRLAGQAYLNCTLSSSVCSLDAGKSASKITPGMDLLVNYNGRIASARL